MRDYSTPRTFILSAYKTKGRNPHADHMDHCDLSCDLALAGFPFRECQGSYKGKTEEAFVVIGALAGPTVRELARLHKQESYLVIAENDRTAYFVDPETGYHTHAGRFVTHGAEEPLTDGWTRVEDTYFTIEPTKGVDLPEGF